MTVRELCRELLSYLLRLVGMSSEMLAGMFHVEREGILGS